jgi:hypothetical protein
MKGTLRPSRNMRSRARAPAAREVTMGRVRFVAPMTLVPCVVHSLVKDSAPLATIRPEEGAVAVPNSRFKQIVMQ